MKRLVVILLGVVPTVCGWGQFAKAQSTSGPAPADAPDEIPAAKAAWLDLVVAKPVPIQKSSVEGRGKTPVIILAEIGTDENTYSDFSKRHAERFTTHTLVMPGASADTRPPALDRGQVRDPVFLVNAIEAVRNYAKEQKLEKPVVIGQGIAGTIAYMLAAKYPEFASAYVILNALPASSVGEPGNIPSKRERPSQVDKLERQALLGMNQNAWLNRIRQTVPGQTASRVRMDALINMMSKLPAQTVRRYMLEKLYLDLRDELGGTTTPILLYVTLPEWMKEMDKLVLRAAFQNAILNRPGSRLEVLDQTRQWVILDEPGKFDPPFLKFLGFEVPEVPAQDEKQENKPKAEAKPEKPKQEEPKKEKAGSEEK